MICRLWRGWTTQANANAYEDVVRTHVIPGIEAMHIREFQSIDLLRRPIGEEDRVEFTTLMWFDSLDDVQNFTGEDYEVSHVPAAAQAVLAAFDVRAAHFEVLERRERSCPQLKAGSRIDLPTTSALVVIDVQQGFLDLDWGPRNNPQAEANIASLIEAWRAAGRPIHHVHHASQSPLGKFREGTPGFAAKDEAAPLEGEPIHVKRVNSGFIGTNLEQALRGTGIDALVIVGLTTNHCVSTTTRMAGNLGFETFIVSDATATFARAALDGHLRAAQDVHDDALSDLSDEFATVVTTQQVLEAVGRRLPAPTPKEHADAWLGGISKGLGGKAMGGNITVDDAEPPPRPLLGLVGGLGPAATTLYYRRLLDGASSRGVKLRLLVNHADVEQVLAYAAADQRRDLALYMDGFLSELRDAGATFLAIGAVTPHLCVPSLPARADGVFIDLVESVDAELHRRELRRVVLLGTQAVTGSGLFGRLPQAVPINDDTVTNRVHDLYVSIVRSEVAAQETAQELRALARDLLSRTGAQAVVLAGTELSLIPQKTWHDLPVIGCAEVHVNALLDAVTAA